MTAGDSALTPESNTREQSPTDVARHPVPSRVFNTGDRVPNLEMWVLQRLLGAGGFGEVWLATHPRKGSAAVKFCTDPAARHKLVTHERAVVARVMKHCGNHPNVVPLLECNLSGDIPWLMYEYVEGGTLADAIDEWRTLTPPRRLGRAVLVLRSIAGALGTFHRLSPPLIHRDMKPQNVLMAGAVPRITDFGIGGAAMGAALTDPDDIGSGLALRLPTMLQTVGSSKYAPQEQMLGSPPNPRDDVFSLGVIAYQLVLGDSKLLPGSDAAARLRALRIPAEIVSLIVRSTALDPERRPRDATEWEEKLARLLRKKTPAGTVPLPDASQDDLTEPLQALGDVEIGVTVSQTIDVPSLGRWYSRPIGMKGDWKLVAATPAEVRLTTGEVYRFSINSAATELDLAALVALVAVPSVRYLNLSFCDGVTDDGLIVVSEFNGLRNLFLRGCRRITDAGLVHLHGLTTLHAIELTDCPGLTAEGIAALRAALPTCKIVA
jgi:serine/threonine protein kinase